ncbi:MAG TPA: HEAT repeat domain-containing protein [Candidatus Koribacter sp.]|jgi:anti-sigma factor RsiW
MNCDWVQQNLTLYLYNELGDDARHELEQHLVRCTDCASEFEATKTFQETMSTLPAPEVTPNLLASSRMRLQESLEHAEQLHGWRRFILDPMALLQRMRVAPALAAAIFIIGFGSGLAVMYGVHPGSVSIIGHPEVHDMAKASIGQVRSVEVQPNSDQVSVNYDRVLPEKVQGSASDPKIQELLAYAARNNDNSGVRLDSVGVLAKKGDDPAARETLTYSLRYDSNPGVRLKALEALEPYVKDDVRVRNAVLEALLNDSNPGVRSGAIHLLEPVKADTSVHAALEQLSKEDPNEYIRTESKRLLQNTPELD